MKSFALLCLSLVACQADPPVRPPTEVDPKNPRSVIEHSVFATRSQKSYRTEFKAQLAPPTGQALDYTGQCVWVSPGILYVHYTASGGDEKMIVRAGARDVWVYHPLLQDWPTADETGMPGAGRGIQNPDEVLAVMARHSGSSKFLKPGTLELTFTGDDSQTIMKEQAQKGAFVWKESSARMEITVDAEFRLKKFTCDASLQAADPNVKGAVRYTGEVTVTGYNDDRELKFMDEKKMEIKLRTEMKEKIDAILKEKK